MQPKGQLEDNLQHPVEDQMQDQVPVVHMIEAAIKDRNLLMKAVNNGIKRTPQQKIQLQSPLGIIEVIVQLNQGELINPLMLGRGLKAEGNLIPDRRL